MLKTRIIAMKTELSLSLNKDKDAAYWLARATVDYERLSASLSALAVELAALETAVHGGSLPASALPLSTQSGAATLPLAAAVLPPTAALRVQMFGSFHLYIGDCKLSADVPAQVGTALKYLVSHRKCPTRRDELIDLFWPDASPAVVGTRLRVLMHSLRKYVPADLVITSNGHFQINPEVSLWVDVEEFEQGWHAGWRLARAGHTKEALAEYERVEALYTGDYLADDVYADWTLLRRESLRDAYATILTMLATISFSEGDYPGSIIWAQKLLSQDNCREDAYRLLISSHKQLGQHTRAHQWYSLCARTLQAELGIEPSAETQRLLSSSDSQ